MKNQVSDSNLYLRFFAKCALLLGVPSLVWETYLITFYPMDPTAAFLRFAFCGGLTIGGLLLVFCVPSHSRGESKRHHRNPFLGSRVDGLFFFGSLLMSLPALLFLPFAISNYFNSLSANASFIPVKVRVESIEVRKVRPESIRSESFYPLYQEVYYVPDRIEDLWIATGEVTILEQDSLSIEPMRAHSHFTVPTIERFRKHSRRIVHHKMDAVMDGERFQVGQTYSGWMLRDRVSDVFFVRRSDKALKDLLLIASLVAGLGIYLFVRIRIGIQRSDRHWNNLRKIFSA